MVSSLGNLEGPPEQPEPPKVEETPVAPEPSKKSKKVLGEIVAPEKETVTDAPKQGEVLSEEVGPSHPPAAHPYENIPTRF